MSRFPRLPEDDDNDTALFDRLEEHVLRNCPNQQRIGCPSLATLQAFVEDPASIPLEQLNDLHIMQCAECTRDLIEFRRVRDAACRKPVPSPSRAPLRRLPHGWLATAACLFVFVGIILSLTRPFGRKPRANEQFLSMTVDLKGAGPSRGFPDDQKPRTRIMLPRNKVRLRLLLPYFSPSGTYIVEITEESNSNNSRVVGRGVATSSGANTEVEVMLDLRTVSPGNYYLSTTLAGDGSSSFYAVTLD